MIVKLELANGTTEIFETSNYVISRPKDFHPSICKVSVYDSGKKIKSVSRLFVLVYKHIIFRTKKVQDLIKHLEEQKQSV